MPFVPDKAYGGARRGFVPDRKRGATPGFVPDRPSTITATSNFIPDEERAVGLFGTKFGTKERPFPFLSPEVSEAAMIAAREPAKMARTGLSSLLQLAPKPETPSVGVNFLRQIPQVGAEFAAGMIEPESAIVGGLGKYVVGPVVRSGLFKETVNKGAKVVPDWLKRLTTYRFGQPEGYKELAEGRIVKIGLGGEKAKEVGQELSKDISRGKQLRTGQILKGGISTSQREAPLRTLAEKARTELTAKASEAVDEGLLNEDKFMANVKEYMPRLYRKYESAKSGLPELFGTKPQRVIGKRFLKKGEIPEPVREIMGEIKEPAYPVAKGIAQLTHDVETAKLFKSVAGNDEWTSDTAREGFVKIAGETKKLGALANKYVHPEIARDIQQILKIPGEFEKYFNDIVGAWKFGKVVLNPSTHARNMMSNSILLDMSGVELHQQPKLLGMAVKEMRSKGKYFTEAKESGLLGQEFVGGEIKGLLDNFDKPASTIFGKAMNVVRGTGQAAAKTYQAEEQLFKMAKFISERERGAGIKAATKEAEKWLFNYGKVSPAVEALRKSPLGAPFITFTSKAMPRVVETLANNPMRLYKYKILFDSMENVANQTLSFVCQVLQCLPTAKYKTSPMSAIYHYHL